MRPAEFADGTDANPIAALRQYPLVVVIFTLLFGGLGAAFALSQPAAFSARGGIVVEDARASTLFNSRSTDAERYVADQVAILESGVVAERASEIAAGLDSPFDITVEDFLSNTTIASSTESSFITISFVASSANKAQAGADAVVQSYVQVIQEALAEDAETAGAELEKAITAAVEEIGALQAQIESLRTDNEERVELDAQLAEIVAGLVELREESAAGAGVSAQIQQLTEELRGRLLVFDVEARSPATAFLLRRQEDTAALLSELTLRRSQIEVDARLAGNGVAFIAPPGRARARGVPTSSTVVLMSAIGALFGAGIAYWLSQRRRYFEDRLAPQSILEAPLLAEVPRLSRTPGRARKQIADAAGSAAAALLPVVNDPASPQAEAFRVLVGVLTQRLEARAKAPSTKGRAAQQGMIIAVCSSMIGEGTTAVAANTALAAGRTGLRIALVDGDFGAQDAARLISAVPHPRPVGLTEVVRDGIRLQDAIVEIDAGPSGVVGLLGRGRSSVAAPEVLGSQAAGRVFTQLADSYDIVIVDLPPLLQVAYATSVVQRADHALVVIRHGSLADNLRELRYRLNVIGVEALGYVYTDVPMRRRLRRSARPSGDVLGTASDT